MRRDNRHCPPGCCKKKKKKNHFIKRVLPHEKTFRFERKIGIFPGLNRAKISILFGPTTKLPLHCSATAIYIQDGNMVIVIKPSANSYDDYAQSRAVREGLVGFLVIFLADRSSISLLPSFAPFPLHPPPSHHQPRSSPDDIFLSRVDYFHKCENLDGRVSLRFIAFKTYKLIWWIVKDRATDENVSSRLTRIQVPNPLEDLLHRWNIIRSWKNYSSFFGRT